MEGMTERHDVVDWSSDEKIARVQESLWNMPKWPGQGRVEYGSLRNNQAVAVHGVKGLQKGGQR